jgi:hypothetical protein
MTSTTTRQALSRRRFRAGELQFDALIAGEGPLVMLLQGFPEGGRTWRAQIQALADAGYTAVAPNLRGYGGSSKPPRVEDYALMRSVGDVEGAARRRLARRKSSRCRISSMAPARARCETGSATSGYCCPGKRIPMQPRLSGAASRSQASEYPACEASHPAHPQLFLVVYRSDTFDTMAPDELQRFHQKWQTWIAEGLQKGWMLDASTALKTEGRVVNVKKVVTDGPFVEGTDVVRGYVNSQSDTFDTASWPRAARSCCTAHGQDPTVLGRRSGDEISPLLTQAQRGSE